MLSSIRPGLRPVLFVSRQGRRDCSRRRLAPGSYHSRLTHNQEEVKSYAHTVPEKTRTQERANREKMSTHAVKGTHSLTEI